MKLALTVAETFRLNSAVSAIAKGFSNGAPDKFVNVITSRSGKRAIAKNMKALAAALDGPQAEMEALREKLIAEERRANPECKELTGDRVAELMSAIKLVNSRVLDVEVAMIDEADLDIDAFVGDGALSALAVIDGTILKDEPVPTVTLTPVVGIK